MIKKIIPFVLCLTPLCAVAAEIPAECSIDANGMLRCHSNGGVNTSVGANNDIVGLATTDTMDIIIENSRGLTLGNGGLTVGKNMYIGTDWNGSTGDSFFAESSTANVFSLASRGDIVVDGSLFIGALADTGRTLNISGNGNNHVSFEQITAYGALDVRDVASFVVGKTDAGVFTPGKIDSDTSLYVETTDGITAGAITAGGNGVTLIASNALTISQLNVTSGDSVIRGGTIESGTIQNASADGDMTITANSVNIVAGDTDGNLENRGRSLTVNADSGITVAGTISNTAGGSDTSAGSMILNVTNTGNVANSGNLTASSIISGGDLTINVAGVTNLANGFNLTKMTASNSFSLTTGKLVLGTDAQDAWLQVFAKDLAAFTFNLTDDIVRANQIVNGSSTNANANMQISGKSVIASATVTNNGDKLYLKSTDANGQISVAGLDTSLSGGTDTQLISAGTLTVVGNISNYGNMLLSAVKGVQLNTVSNSGEKFEIVSSTDSVSISSNVTNYAGELSISGLPINISGELQNHGGNTTLISLSDITLNGVSVDAGAVLLNSAMAQVNNPSTPQINSTKAMSVSGTGTLAFDKNVHTVGVTGGAISATGDFKLTSVQTAGHGDINALAYGAAVELSSDNAINIYGNVIATDASLVDGTVATRTAQLMAPEINIGISTDETSGNVTVTGTNNTIIFGESGAGQTLTALGNIVASNHGIIELYTDVSKFAALSGNGIFRVHGRQLTATNGDIDVGSSVWFDGTTDATTGMMISGTNTLAMQSDKGNVNVTGGVTIGGGNTLNLTSVASDVTIGGVVDISNGGKLTVSASKLAQIDKTVNNQGTLVIIGSNVDAQAINNKVSGSSVTISSTGNVDLGSLSNTGTMAITGTGKVTTSAIENTGGVLNITADSLESTIVTVSGGTANWITDQVDATSVTVNGNLYNGTNSGGVLSIRSNDITVNANALTVNNGDLIVDATSDAATVADYNISGVATIDNNINVRQFATLDLSAGTINSGDIVNNGTLILSATDGMGLGTISSNGYIELNSNNTVATVTGLTVSDATLVLMGRGLTATGAALDNQGVFGVSGKLYQNYDNALLLANDANIKSGNYTLTVGNVKVTGIEQKSGSLVLNSSDVKVSGDIRATDLRIAANPRDNWLKMTVGGGIYGNTQLIGLESLTVDGGYLFDNNSQINAAILKYADTAAPNTTTSNYWSVVSLNDDDSLGIISNPDDGQALINVKGVFTSTADAFKVGTNGGTLARPQIGLVLDDIVNPGTAIWFLHADGGIQDDDLTSKLRNLSVTFCNADGSICYNYLDALSAFNETSADLPVYLSVRDTDSNGISDSLYIVFDPRFGGPVEVFKIQPLVEEVANHTLGEYETAGAIDNLIATQLHAAGFYNRTPIEIIPLAFQNTTLSVMSDELYKRLEYWGMNRDKTPLAQFVRLFQPRELEQIVGGIVLNDHTASRSFEDRMFDEFIWNRNRNLVKAWADVDFGMHYQDVRDGKHADGNRLSLSAGFDWQQSQTLILGVAGRISHTASKSDDFVNLGFVPGQDIDGNVRTDVTDTNFGVGAYLMQLLNTKMRLYANAFLDMHVLDVDREQNFVADIHGDGHAFSLTSEIGFMHDWLNQYIVGNLYARVGYNTGFTLDEKTAGHNYMKMESDGYLMLTPGYSLIAQKRIYPSVWFQIRPYASIGVEYDVLGAPNNVKYRFAIVDEYTSYDVNLDPLWANIGGGVELLSARGIQFGIDYRYQYNQEIQLHNIRVSGSYRF